MEELYETLDLIQHNVEHYNVYYHKRVLRFDDAYIQEHKDIITSDCWAKRDRVHPGG